jgi:rod shape-determining protein MreD
VQALKLVAAIALAVLVHFVGMSFFPSLGRLVDVFLVVVALYGLRGGSLSALLVGLLVGLLRDSLSGGPFGLFGFADTIVGYVTARLAQRLVIQRPTGILAVVSFASLLQQAIIIGLAFVLLPALEAPSPLDAALRAGICGLLAMAAHVLASHGRSTLEARRRGRMSKLRLG